MIYADCTLPQATLKIQNVHTSEETCNLDFLNLLLSLCESIYPSVLKADNTQNK